MQAATLRRYLQPSEKLRWHPWAPLVVLLLALLFAFASGAYWGFSAARRDVEMHDLGRVSLAMMRRERPDEVRHLVMEAIDIDRQVRRWSERAEPSPVEQWLDRVELTFIYGWSGNGTSKLAFVRKLAEYRLAKLSGDAAGWQRSAGYCEVFSRGPHKVADDFAGAAAAYSRLLGRQVTAQQLAPAVPGGTC